MIFVVWNNQGENTVVFTSSSDWICVWGPVMDSQVRCHRVFAVSPRATWETDRETSYQKPSTGLAIWGEKKTSSSHLRMSTLKLSPRPQTIPFPGFLAGWTDFWTKSPRSFPRSEWVLCTWLLTMPLGEMYLSRTFSILLHVFVYLPVSSLMCKLLKLLFWRGKGPSFLFFYIKVIFLNK